MAKASRTPLLEDALKRAKSKRQGNASAPTTAMNSGDNHPLESSPQILLSPAVDAAKARKDWQLHGAGLSQASEEKRRPMAQSDVVVRILAAEERTDLSGSAYTAYIISVLQPESSPTPILVEHRYSDFSKLNAALKNYNVALETSFPSKHWAGSLVSMAPSQREDLVSYRKVQLDQWLIQVVEALNRDRLPRPVKEEVLDFLSSVSKAPCDCVNEMDRGTGSVERQLRWNNPLACTLGSSIRQATYTLQYMCAQDGLTESDSSIPLDLLHHAKGLCFLTVLKAGLVVSGRIGTGLVIIKRPNGTWSAPSGLGNVGVGWGAQLGGDVTHYLIVLTTTNAVDALSASSSVTLGAELGVAVGPIGRGATSHISSSSLLEPAYSYAHSQGLFVGVSLEGSLVHARHDVNAIFYGRPIEVREILAYMNPPKAAEPLYQALENAMRQEIPAEGLRPSTLFATCSPDRTLVGGTVNSTPTSVVTRSPGYGMQSLGYESPSTPPQTRSLFDTPDKFES
jgi:lipid-binding SYLF domain-containing protein